MATDGLAGLRARDTSGGVTVICEEPLTAPAEAVIVVDPKLCELTIPELPASLVIPATLGEDEFQFTDCRICVLKSANVPVATRGRFVPRTIGNADGLTVMDTSPFGVRLAG
jgi:hypothetical protein